MLNLKDFHKATVGLMEAVRFFSGYSNTRVLELEKTGMFSNVKSQPLGPEVMVLC